MIAVRMLSLCFVGLFGFGMGSMLPGSRAVQSAVITGQGKALDGDSVLVGSSSAIVNVRLYRLRFEVRRLFAGAAIVCIGWCLV